MTTHSVRVGGCSRSVDNYAESVYVSVVRVGTSTELHRPEFLLPAQHLQRLLLQYLNPVEMTTQTYHDLH
jgi:hypothetical protein